MIRWYIQDKTRIYVNMILDIVKGYKIIYLKEWS
jgi:hypothetical protein